MPKVSIVMPLYNQETYIRECLDSVVKQTLKDVEIIIVNDGSTDNSSYIVNEYAQKDSRIIVVDKSNSGYGDSMNVGLSKATGEYIGIVETDDFVDPDMFDTLYKTAIKYKADVVKSNFWLYWSKPERNELHEYFKEEECGKIIIPGEFDKGSLFNRKPSIWSAIYKRDFLEQNNISFLPTPGASYQDTSFTFKVYTKAERMVCLYDAFLHYRQDNEGSSINNVDKKMNCIFDEYGEIAQFIEKESDEDYKKRLYQIYGAAFYDTCIWMYECLSPKKRYEFLKIISPIFNELVKKIGVDKLNFRNMWWKRRDIMRIAQNPYEYHMWRNDERYDQNASNIEYSITTTPLNNLSQVALNQKKKESPTFSVIMPVYNVEKYLSSSLESLLLQTYQDVEIICINDGSSDHSLSVLESYAKIDNRILIINQDNSGPSTARNNGLSVAQGEYIIFLDSDDYLMPNALEILKENIDRQEKIFDAIEFGAEPFPSVPRASDWLYSVLTTSDEYYEKIEPKTFLTTKTLQIYCWRYCFKRNFIKKNDLKFDTEFKHGEDALFMLNAINKMHGLVVISDKLYCYRHIRIDSLMNQITRDGAQFAAQQLNILEQMLIIALEKGFVPSTELLEYSCDFVYSSINNCPANKKVTYIIRLLDIFKKFGLNKYVEESSDNCRGFYNYCLSAKQMYKRQNNLKGKFKHLMARIIFPSRKIFYEHSARLLSHIEALQHSVNFLQQQVNDLQSKIDRRNDEQ